MNGKEVVVNNVVGNVLEGRKRFSIKLKIENVNPQFIDKLVQLIKEKGLHYTIFENNEKAIIELSSAKCNTHKFIYNKKTNTLIYKYSGARYGLIGEYSKYLSEVFSINLEKIIVFENYDFREYKYSQWKTNAEKLFEKIKRKEAYLEVKIENETKLAKIVEYTTSAEQWKLLPLELVVRNQDNKVIASIPMILAKPYPIYIDELNDQHKQYIRPIPSF